MEIYQPVALFLAGIVSSGVAMMLRGDWVGRKAAEEVEVRLSKATADVEGRLNERIDREMRVISGQLKDIKDSLIRLEERN